MADVVHGWNDLTADQYAQERAAWQAAIDQFKAQYGVGGEDINNPLSWSQAIQNWNAANQPPPIEGYMAPPQEPMYTTLYSQQPYSLLQIGLMPEQMPQRAFDVPVQVEHDTGHGFFNELEPFMPLLAMLPAIVAGGVALAAPGAFAGAGAGMAAEAGAAAGTAAAAGGAEFLTPMAYLGAGAAEAGAAGAGFGASSLAGAGGSLLAGDVAAGGIAGGSLGAGIGEGTSLAAALGTELGVGTAVPAIGAGVAGETFLDSLSLLSNTAVGTEGSLGTAGGSLLEGTVGAGGVEGGSLGTGGTSLGTAGVTDLLETGLAQPAVGEGLYSGAQTSEFLQPPTPEPVVETPPIATEPVTPQPTEVDLLEQLAQVPTPEPYEGPMAEFTEAVPVQETIVPPTPTYTPPVVEPQVPPTSEPYEGPFTEFETSVPVQEGIVPPTPTYEPPYEPTPSPPTPEPEPPPSTTSGGQTVQDIAKELAAEQPWYDKLADIYSEIKPYTDLATTALQTANAVAPLFSGSSDLPPITEPSFELPAFPDYSSLYSTTTGQTTPATTQAVTNVLPARLQGKSPADIDRENRIKREFAARYKGEMGQYVPTYGGVGTGDITSGYSSALNRLAGIEADDDQKRIRQGLLPLRSGIKALV